MFNNGDIIKYRINDIGLDTSKRWLVVGGYYNKVDLVCKKIINYDTLECDNHYKHVYSREAEIDVNLTRQMKIKKIKNRIESNV
jgi:hypothetical protein